MGWATRRRLVTVAGAVVATLGCAGGIAWASIPSSSGVITACYKTASAGHGSGAALSVIDTSSTSCPSGYTSLPWSQAGPQGPAGATGATGSAGPGVGDEITVFTNTTVDFGDPAGTIVNTNSGPCPSGYGTVSGGFIPSGSIPAGEVWVPVAEYADIAGPGSVNNRWNVQVEQEGVASSGSGTWNLATYAYCLPA
jgi:hypothetical protein